MENSVNVNFTFFLLSQLRRAKNHYLPFEKGVVRYQISKHWKLIFCTEKLGHRMRRKVRMCVFLCVGEREEATCNYILESTSTHEKGLDPLLPQIDITQQCESLCTRQIIFETLPEPTLGFDNGTE